MILGFWDLFNESIDIHHTESHFSGSFCYHGVFVARIARSVICSAYFMPPDQTQAVKRCTRSKQCSAQHERR